MRICMVAWSFYPRVGGSVTTVIELSQALVNAGISVNIIAPLLKRDVYRIKYLNIDKRVKIQWVVSSLAKSYSDFYSRLIFLIKMIFGISKLSKDIDIFHAHDFNVGLFASIFGTRKPVVCIFGADPLFETFNFNKKKCIDYKEFIARKDIKCLQGIFRAALAVFARQKLTVVAYNEHTNSIVKRYHSGKLSNIPAAVNIDYYARYENKEENDILYVSRFVCWKNLDMAIEAFKKVKERRPESTMICIGNGPLKDRYLNVYGNEKGLAFLADLCHREAVEYYKKSRVLLITSQYETFGINIIEAMAAGVPIVATDLDVFHDRLINNVNCYLIADGNVSIFTDRILDLLNNDSIRERYVINSLDMVKNYSIGKICNRYINLYNSLLGL